MAMDIIAYFLAAISLAAGILCFIDDNWGKKMSQNVTDLVSSEDEKEKGKYIR